ncbi:MAG: efflux RND transporter periplasmic adaptor subunit [Bacteroidota bacterium]
MKNQNYIKLFLLIALIIGCSDNNDSDLIEKSGTIETTNIIISSQVTGTIVQINVQEGETIKEGDTLGVVDHEKLGLQLEQAEASLQAATAQLKILKRGAREEDKKQADEVLKQAELNLTQATKNKERMEKLFSSHAITEKQHDDAITAYEVALSKYNTAKHNVRKIKSARPEEIERAEANVKKSETTINLIKKSIDDCHIISPISGQVVNGFVEIGESASYMSSLFKISNLNVAELKIYVTEKELALVKHGQSAKVSIDAFDDKNFEGKVVFISPEAEFTPKNIQTKDERTKLVFAVKIKIDNPDHFLKPGMPADVEIEL